MKKFLVLVLLCSGMTSCAPLMYQQIATIQSDQVSINENGDFIAKTSEFTILYDFWAPSGMTSFMVSNNSDEDIYLNMSESYYIRNGYAHDYYQGRVYVPNSRTSPNVLSATVAASGDANKFGLGSEFGSGLNSTTKASSVSRVEYVEQKIICIPAHSRKAFEQFNVQPEAYRECGFIRNPKSRETAVKKFTEENSPVVIEKRIMFEVSGKKVPVNHKFYVSKLQNISENSVYQVTQIKRCDGYNSSTQVLLHKMLAPDRYYIRYTPYYNESDRTRKQ